MRTQAVQAKKWQNQTKNARNIFHSGEFSDGTFSVHSVTKMQYDTHFGYPTSHLPALFVEKYTYNWPQKGHHGP